MRVICISGKARHGKDTMAEFVKERLEASGNKVLIAHYGDLVKYICAKFFGWNGEKDEAGRTILQRVGTDEIRKVDPNYWVNFIIDILKIFPNEWDYVIIPDCRFPNEINSLKESGFDVFHARVVRTNFESNLTEAQKNHASETAMDNVIPDLITYNSSTMDDFRDTVFLTTNRILKMKNW